jgi:hypothetical protein
MPVLCSITEMKGGQMGIQLFLIYYCWEQSNTKGSPVCSFDFVWDVDRVIEIIKLSGEDE